MKKITLKWLEEKRACKEAIESFKAQKETDAKQILDVLIKEHKLNWANWLIVRIMTRNQHIQYAIYAAEQVIEIFEKKYPNDNRPRAAIEAAKKYLGKPTKANRSAARSAAWSAESAAWSAARSAAWSAAWSAARSAWSAARSAAESAESAAESAESAAWSAAWSAGSAAWSAAWSAGRSEMKLKILKYGITLLEGK